MKTKFNNITTKEYLLSVEVPEESRTYKPINHSVLIDNTLEGIENSNFTVASEMYYSGAKGQQMLGRYGLKLDSTDIGIQIAFHNSYDKSLSLKYAIGEYVFICANGCVSGSYDSFKSKHVGKVQDITPVNIKDYLNGISDKFQSVVERKSRFEEIEVTKKTCAELLGRLFVEEEIITSTQLNIVKSEILNPSFNYNADGSLWQFWNHLTYSMSETAVPNYIDKSLKLFNFFEQEYA